MRLWLFSFHGQGQLYPLTCAERRDLSNHTSTIQSRRPERKAKNQLTWTWKFPWKSCSTTQLYLSFHLILRSLKLSWKLFPPKWSLLNAQQKKNMRQDKQKERGGEKVKSKSLKISKFCFLRMPQLCKLIFLNLEQKCTTCKWRYGKF